MIEEEPIFRIRLADPTREADLLPRLVEALDNHDLSGIALLHERKYSGVRLLALLREYDVVVLGSRVVAEPFAPGVPVIIDENQPGWLETASRKLAAAVAGREKVRPVWGCVLIGGKSSRMGQPKHLLPGPDGRSWLARSLELLSPLVDGLAVSGRGTLPPGLDHDHQLVRLPDIPGIEGPVTGLLSAFRWQPRVSWLVVACDMPNLSVEAVRWLLSQRRTGCWGILPRLPGNSHVEPLFAWYDCRGMALFEQLALENIRRVGAVRRFDKMASPEVPKELQRSWQNVNTPEELQKLSAEQGE